MANVTVKNIKDKSQSTFAAYGNAWAKNFTFQTNASGVFVDSDQTTAVVQTNVVRLGILPAGLELHDALEIVSDAFTAATTADIGFAYVDGVDVTAVPQDADYFDAALDTASTGRTRASNLAVTPIVLPKDAYLILTIAGADHAAAGRLDVLVFGVWTGVPA
jgi:hypothetical protein